MSFEENRALGAALKAHARRVLVAGADAAAETLRENLSEGTRTGRRYSGLPNRSSAASEYPQEQFGDLRAGVFSQPAGDGAEVGIANNAQSKLNRLEFAPPSGGGRAPIARTMQDARTRQAMKRAMEAEGRT